MIFIHIPKTAGTSFNHIIKQNGYGDDGHYTYKGLRKFISDDLGSVDIIHGHVPYGLHLLKHRKATYVTFLRDPVDRCISFYYFVQEWYKHPDYHIARQLSIVDFYRLKQYQNAQTSYLGGNALLPFNLPVQLQYQLALKRINRKKIIFGIQEHFTESVNYLCDQFNWQNRPIIHSKRAKLRPKREAIQQKDLEMIAKLNDYDFRLYNYALNYFKNVAL